MGKVPATSRYPAMTQILHWGSVALIVCAFTIGLLIEEWPRGPQREFVIMIHFSVGILVLALACIRLVRRVLLSQPTDLPTLSGWVRRAAKAMHWTLYAMTIVLPVVGLCARWAVGRRLAIFGDVVIPAPFAIPGGKLWEETHAFLAYTLAGLVAAHLAAALWHHFIIRDETLTRMLPRSVV